MARTLVADVARTLVSTRFGRASESPPTYRPRHQRWAGRVSTRVSRRQRRVSAPRATALSPISASQAVAGALDYTVLAGGLSDFNCLVFGHRRKSLRLCISRPLNLQPQDLCRFSQP